jgi:adenosylcobinamide kinase / adenosylcobinamide-phosphate guanylyltransferase
VLFAATAEALDDEMRQRIETHKRNRPASWTTLEAASGLGSKIPENTGGIKIVLIDCITLLVNAVFNRFGENLDYDELEKAAVAEITGLIECMKSLEDKDFIIVTNEVGLGLVPDNEAGRYYRDILGRANSLLAAYCDEVFLTVSGLPLKIKPAS